MLAALKAFKDDIARETTYIHESIMAQNQEAEKTGVPESEASTRFTPPPTYDGTASCMSETNVPDPLPTSSIPWPGSTYIIRSVATGRVITFRGGKVVLAPLNGISPTGTTRLFRSTKAMDFVPPPSRWFVGSELRLNLRI